MDLPKGWVTAKLIELVSTSGIFCDGDWVESKDQDPNGEVRLIQLADIGDGKFIDKSNRFLTKGKAAVLHCTYLNKGDLLIARMPSPLGRVAIFPLDGSEKYVTVVDVAILRLAHDLISDKYCSYMINALPTRNLIAKQQSGTTRKRIARSKLEEISIPVPPLAEQRRIVAKIDSLFSELDKGVEMLHTIRAQLRTYRQAVLKWAFEGNFTNTTLTSVSLSDYIEKPRYGTSKKCISGKGDVCVLRIPNIDYDAGVVRYKDVKFANFIDDEIETLSLHNGDILIIRSNGSVSLVGRAAIVREKDNKSLFAGYLMRLRINKPQLLPQFLLRYLASPTARTYIENRAKSTNGVHNINSDEIRALIIPFCSTDEQTEIVSAIESRLSVCDKLDQNVGESLAKAQALRQSILKKAFVGHLVSQDPNDEPAEKLLERIKALKSNVETRDTATRGKRK
jgi:type I restriction enzyme S subunit